MLKESSHVKQVPGENRRRWFSDRTMDLTVWFDGSGDVTGFELCYDKGRNERAVRWRRGSGFLHQQVDDGEGRPGRYKGTPILVPDGAFAADEISRQFRENSRDIDREVADLVLRMLREYPSAPVG